MGNMVAVQDWSTGMMTAFSYLYDGRLGSYHDGRGNTSHYVYTPKKQRFAILDQTSGDICMFHEDEDVIWDYAVNGNEYAALSSYVNGPGIDMKIARLNLRSQATAGWFYYVADKLKTLHMVIDTHARCANRYILGAWGEDIILDSRISERYSFLGQRERMEEMPFVYIRRRTCLPSLGRFSAPDPAGIFEGRDYCYAGNCPTLYADPTGRVVEFEDAEAAYIRTLQGEKCEYVVQRDERWFTAWLESCNMISAEWGARLIKRLGFTVIEAFVKVPGLNALWNILINKTALLVAGMSPEDVLKKGGLDALELLIVNEAYRKELDKIVGKYAVKRGARLATEVIERLRRSMVEEIKKLIAEVIRKEAYVEGQTYQGHSVCGCDVKGTLFWNPKTMYAVGVFEGYRDIDSWSEEERKKYEAAAGRWGGYDDKMKSFIYIYGIVLNLRGKELEGTPQRYERLPHYEKHQPKGKRDKRRN
jgi:RHS repeat-associated protein